MWKRIEKAIPAIKKGSERKSGCLALITEFSYMT